MYYVDENFEIAEETIEISQEEVEQALLLNPESTVQPYESFAVNSFIFDDSGDGGSSSYPDPVVESNYPPSTTYKDFDMYGVYYYDIGTQGQFYVNVKMKWLTTPSRRYTDVIAIGFLGNVQLANYNGTSNPDIYSEFTYKNYSSMSGQGTTITYPEEKVYPHNTSSYVYDLSERKLLVPYDLPQDIVGAGGGYSVASINSNFEFLLEARFNPTITNLAGATFAGTYLHQIGSGYPDWGNLSITTTPPFFSYSTSFWVNDPSYDSGIGATLIFENLR